MPHDATPSPDPMELLGEMKKAAMELLDCLDQLEKEEAEQGGIHDAGCIVCIAAEKVRNLITPTPKGG